MSYFQKFEPVESVINYEPKLLVQQLRITKVPLHEAEPELTMFKHPRNKLPHDPDILSNNYQLKLDQFVKYLSVYR